MPVAVFSHPDCLLHDTGSGHPENAGRLAAVLSALRTCDFHERLVFPEAPEAKEAQLLLAHAEEYIRYVRRAFPGEGYAYLDGDTVLSPGSWKAALRASGAGCAAVDGVMAGQYASAFCAVRPPGHHATSDNAMGFCIFNNIAIAALYAIAEHALERVAIVDFDVHHGNGTQAIMERNRRVLFISTHQMLLWPGTGGAKEKGIGNILNIPLSPGTDGAKYRKIFQSIIVSALARFKPELLLISAGFDAHRDDPLAQLTLEEEDYGWIGAQLRAVAEKHCRGRVISFLEGGYNHAALAASAVKYAGAFV